MGVFVENLQEIINKDFTASEKLSQMIENHFNVLGQMILI